MQDISSSNVDGAVPRARLRKILGVRRSTFVLAMTTILYLAYLVLGSYVFNILETKSELIYRKQVRMARDIFLKYNRCVKGKYINYVTMTNLVFSKCGLQLSRNVLYNRLFVCLFTLHFLHSIGIRQFGQGKWYDDNTRVNHIKPFKHVVQKMFGL